MSASPRRPHLLGIDDGPFGKESRRPVPIVGVLMEGHDLVEAVVMTHFPVDGDDVTEFLAGWIAGLRCQPSVHAVVFGGISIAGLAIIDIAKLAERLSCPVAVVNRQRPENDALERALETAGLSPRIDILRRSPSAWALSQGLYVAHAGAPQTEVRDLLHPALGKSQLPEPLRLAHLIAAATVQGESRGRP